jgi:hypothetical protein
MFTAKRITQSQVCRNRCSSLNKGSLFAIWANFFDRDHIRIYAECRIQGVDRSAVPNSLDRYRKALKDLRIDRSKEGFELGPATA